MFHIQFIKRDDQPVFAVVPIDVWERIKHLVEDPDDVALFDYAKSQDDGTRLSAADLDAQTHREGR